MQNTGLHQRFERMERLKEGVVDGDSATQVEGELKGAIASVVNVRLDTYCFHLGDQRDGGNEFFTFCFRDLILIFRSTHKLIIFALISAAWRR